MSLGTKTSETADLLLKSIQSVQAAGFKAASSVAEKTPGLPRLLGTFANRGNSSWVEGYFDAAQRVLDVERRAAEQALALAHAFASPRVARDDEAPLQAV